MYNQPKTFLFGRVIISYLFVQFLRGLNSSNKNVISKFPDFYRFQNFPDHFTEFPDFEEKPNFPDFSPRGGHPVNPWCTPTRCTQTDPIKFQPINPTTVGPCRDKNCLWGFCESVTYPSPYLQRLARTL